MLDRNSRIGGRAQAKQRAARVLILRRVCVTNRLA